MQTAIKHKIRKEIFSMGKGNRNRSSNAEAALTTPKKNKPQKKDNSSRILTVVLIAIAVVVVVSIAASFLADSGLIRRNRVLLKSQTGKFDVNQQMVTYLAWEEMFSTFQATYGNYISSGQITNSTYSDEYEFALYTSQYFISANLGSVVKDMTDDLLGCVAVCDYAYTQGMRLDEREQASIDAVISNLKSINSTYYNPYGSLNQFLNTFVGSGIKESDVRNALKMTRLYSKYVEQLEDGYEGSVLPEELKAYIEEHKSEFYKTDVLQYIADEAFIKELANCTTTAEFREKALGHFFDKNYKTLFNKHTVVQTAKDELASYKGITNSESGNALDDKLNELKFEPVKSIGKDDASYPQSVRDWLFGSKRTQCDSVLLETAENGVYLLSYYSEKAADTSTTEVLARIKHFELSDGVSYEGNENFRAEMRAEFISDDDDKGSDKYETLDERAEKLEAQLKAAIDADNGNGHTNVQSFFDGYKQYNPTEFTFQIDDGNKTKLLPESIYDDMRGNDANTQKGSYNFVGASEDSSFGYLYYVKEANERSEEYTIIYMGVDNDLYYAVLNDIQTTLDNEFAFETTMSYSKPKDDGSYTKVSEWLFLNGRKENDAAYFVTQETDEDTKEKRDVFTAYIVKGTPMYIEHGDVVNGGFATFTKEEDAKAALEVLKGLTGVPLRNEFEALNAVASTYDSGLDESQTNTYHRDLTAWFFSDERKANDYALISAGGKYYVCVYFGTMDTADRTAKDGLINDRVKADVDALAKAVDKNGKPIYQINERVLEKFKVMETSTATNELEGTTAAA